MSTLTYNQIGLSEQTIDLNNDSNSDNTITNSIHSTQVTSMQTQEMTYQKPMTYSVSCEELKKLQKVNSAERLYSSPASLQLNYQKISPNQSLTESPASVSTIASTTTSKSSEHNKGSKGIKNGKNSNGSNSGNFNGIAILGQPIILTPENKKLLEKLRKGQIKNAPKLAILSNPAFPSTLFSKRSSQENIVFENPKVNAPEEGKKVEKKEKEKEKSEEEKEEETYSSTSEVEEDDENNDNDFSHIIMDKDSSDEEEDDDEVDKEIIYPMREGFVLRDDDEEEEEKQQENTTSDTTPKEKTDKKKKSKMVEKSNKDEKSVEEKKSEEPAVESEKATEDAVGATDLPTYNNNNARRMSMVSMVSSIDPNCSFYSLPAGGVSGSCLPVQKAASEVSGSFASNSSIDPNGSFFIPSPGLGDSILIANSIPTPFECSSASAAPIDTKTDTNQLVVNIQGHQIPIEQIQQAYSFLGKTTNHQNQNQNPIAEKIKNINNTQKLVSFNLQEKTTMPHSTMVKNTPPILETAGQPKGTSGVPSKTSRMVKAKQTIDTAAIKRQSWCNVNSDILGNAQPLSNRRSSSFPQFPRYGPLVDLPMNQLLNRDYSGPNVNSNLNNINSYGNAAAPYMSLPNPALINLPYGTIINTNAYTTHNSVNPHTRKDEKGEEREDLIRKDMNRQRVERIERWAKESKATMCPIKENKTLSPKDRRASTTHLHRVPITYVNGGKKSKSYDNIKQIYTIEEDNTPLALVRGHLTHSSESSSPDCARESTSSDSDDDDVPLQMIAKNGADKHPAQPSQEVKKRHSMVMDNSMKRHSMVMDSSMKRHSIILDDGKKRHSMVIDDGMKRHSMAINPAMDASMRHHEHHRHSQVYGPPSPTLYSVSSMGPLEVIPMPQMITSKKNKRRSYAPGMLSAEYPDYMMNYAAAGGVPAAYYQAGAAPVQSNPNVYGVKYSQGHGHGHAHAHTHANQYASGYANTSRAYYQATGHHSRVYM